MPYPWDTGRGITVILLFLSIFNFISLKNSNQNYLKLIVHALDRHCRHRMRVLYFNSNFGELLIHFIAILTLSHNERMGITHQKFSTVCTPSMFRLNAILYEWWSNTVHVMWNGNLSSGSPILVHIKHNGSRVFQIYFYYFSIYFQIFSFIIN